MNSSATFGMAIVAALLQRDARGATAALAALDATRRHGALLTLERRRAAAGIAALNGKPEGAVAGFRAVREEFRRMDLPYPLAMTDLVMAAVLDPALPDVVDAAAEARVIFTRLGAQAWPDRLDEALSQEGAATPARSERRRQDVKDATPAP